MKTFKERFEYLSKNIRSNVGDITFGYDRHLNQKFYHSKEWLNFRNIIIIRDNACDLGVDNYEIISSITIHHIDPITIDDIRNGGSKLFDPNNAITTCEYTHRMLHYGSMTSFDIVERRENDTCPWKMKVF